MYHDGIVCLVYFFVPHFLKDFIRAEHAARIRREKVQDIELDRSQLDLLPVTLWLSLLIESPRIVISFFAAFPVLLFGFNWV